MLGCAWREGLLEGCFAAGKKFDVECAGLVLLERGAGDLALGVRCGFGLMQTNRP